MRDRPPDFEQLAELAWALANDRLDSDGASRLRELLAGTAANRRAYIELTNLLAALERGEWAGVRQSAAGGVVYHPCATAAPPVGEYRSLTRDQQVDPGGGQAGVGCPTVHDDFSAEITAAGNAGPPPSFALCPSPGLFVRQQRDSKLRGRRIDYGRRRSRNMDVGWRRTVFAIIQRVRTVHLQTAVQSSSGSRVVAKIIKSVGCGWACADVARDGSDVSPGLLLLCHLRPSGDQVQHRGEGGDSRTGRVRCRRPKRRFPPIWQCARSSGTRRARRLCRAVGEVSQGDSARVRPSAPAPIYRPIWQITRSFASGFRMTRRIAIP